MTFSFWGGGAEEKGGPCARSSVLETLTLHSPSAPHSCSPSLCYGPTELPSSHGIPTPSRPAPGGAWAPACTSGCAEGFGELLAPPGMLGRRAFGVFWHLQACRGEASRLLAPPACWRGCWGLTFRHVGGVEGLMAPPDVLWWAFWGLLGSPFMLGGILMESQHLQVCLGEVLG